MPEVKIIGRQYTVKTKTFTRVAFVDGEHIDARFGSVADFLNSYGTNRKVVIKGHTKYAVVCAIEKVRANMCTNVMTQPIGTPPWVMPSGFWVNAAADARSALKPERGNKAVIPGSTKLVDLIKPKVVIDLTSNHIYV